MNTKKSNGDEITTTRTTKARHGEDKERKKMRDRFENGFFSGLLVNFLIKGT